MLGLQEHTITPKTFKQVLGIELRPCASILPIEPSPKPKAICFWDEMQAASRDQAWVLRKEGSSRGEILTRNRKAGISELQCHDEIRGVSD